MISSLHGPEALVDISLRSVNSGLTGFTINLSVEVLPVPPSFDVTVTEFVCPVKLTVVEVTSTVTVQVAPAARVTPVISILVAVDVVKIALVQVVVGEVVAIISVGKLSVKLTLANDESRFGLVMVKLRMLFPFTGMGLGENDFTICGGPAVTVNVSRP